MNDVFSLNIDALKDNEPPPTSSNDPYNPNIKGPEEIKGIIPDEFQNQEILSDLGNYIFQGEFTGNYNEDTFYKMQSTAEILIQADTGCSLKCDESPQYTKD